MYKMDIIGSNIDDDVPMHRAGYAIKHYGPYFILILTFVLLCIACSHPCCYEAWCSKSYIKWRNRRTISASRLDILINKS